MVRNKNAPKSAGPKREERPKIMMQPLPKILDELEKSLSLANEAAKDARKAAEEARKAGEKAAEEATAIATMKAEEAISKLGSVPKMVRQIISSREFILFAVIVALGSIFAAVAISVGLSSLRP